MVYLDLRPVRELGLGVFGFHIATSWGHEFRGLTHLRMDIKTWLHLLEIRSTIQVTVSDFLIGILEW